MNIDTELNWLKSIGLISSWDDLNDEDAERLEMLFRTLEDYGALTEQQGRNLYFSIGGMLDGYGDEVDTLLSRVKGYPFDWVLYDDRDESESEDFVKNMKISSIEMGQNFPIYPFPTYRFDNDPVSWIKEVLAVNLDTYSLQKLFLYLTWSLGGILAPTPRILENSEGRKLLISMRDVIEGFSPRSDNLEREKRNTLEMLDFRIASINV